MDCRTSQAAPKSCQLHGPFHIFQIHQKSSHCSSSQIELTTPSLFFCPLLPTPRVQTQMPPVAKQVRDLYIWSCPFRLLFVFLLDRVMDTGKYFSSVGEVAGMSMMINGKWPTAEQCRQREERRWLWPESYQLHPVVAMCQQGPNLPIFPKNPEIQKLIRT